MHNGKTKQMRFYGFPSKLKEPGDALAFPAGVEAALAGPRAASSTVSGFDALDNYDQSILADKGNQYDLEPPDQALAVGNGFVVEAVNNALMVFDTTGKRLLAAPVSINKFFNQVSEDNRGTTPHELGPQFSDPRAFYDASTQRFFVVEWATLVDASGNPLNVALQFIAVSTTSDPTGTWSLSSFETTNPTLPGCPCFGDFQQLGVDANGIYLSMDLFGITTSQFAGAKIYALSKAALEAGSSTAVLEFPASTHNFKIFPTQVPTGGNFATEANGTEYFVESVADLTRTGSAKALKLYAISNTASLNTGSPSLTLADIKVPSQAVVGGNGLPPGIQPDGPRPLGGPNGLNDPKPELNPDDPGFTSNPVYVNGNIWAALETAVQPDKKTPAKTGVAWFEIAASGGSSHLAGTVSHQGVVYGPGKDTLLYPAVAMPTTGLGGLGVTFVGPNNYPSTAYIPLSEAGTGAMQLSGIGSLPDDGFTAYAQFGGGGIGRWGDYGAAAVDENGALWFANEYIPNTTTNPRTTYANWGTYISQSH